ncbi:MAG: hypothetical protein JWP69_784 [Flaviaesturariibacter sp.]|nr:hypothetical protein [Flaviaesturariibacter sp.]
MKRNLWAKNKKGLKDCCGAEHQKWRSIIFTKNEPGSLTSRF